MPASAANVPSAVPTLPNLFDAVDDADEGDDYPVVATRSLGPNAASPPVRPSPVRLAPALAPGPTPSPRVGSARQTLLPAAPASDADGWLVLFDDEDDDVTVETASSAKKQDDEEAITNADVIEEEVVAVENLESGIRRSPISLPPPLPRAAAPAPPLAVARVAPPSPPPPPSAAAAPPPSVPPARSRLWAEDRDL